MPLKMHFLNVGRGDCTIIEFDSGRIAIVDIDTLRTFDSDTERELVEQRAGEYDFTLMKSVQPHAAWGMLKDYLKEKESEISDPFAYYDNNIGRQKRPFRVMISHPDMDHMTGLHRLATDYGLENFWHTGRHDFNLGETTDAEWAASPYSKTDWDTYRALRDKDGRNPTSLHQYQGDTGQYWTDDSVEVWAPTPDLEESAVAKNEPNILSMILKITWAGRSIVLGGDATADDTWATIYPDLDMSAISLLKASHHGRNTGYYWPAVKEMSPWLTITSVGEKAYDATEKYRRYSDHTVSLRDCGDILITIRDDGVLVYPSKIEEHWKDKKPY